jgi:hypothetical protein
MSSIKYLFLIIILVIGMISLGCVGKKPVENGITTPAQPTVTPAQVISTPGNTILENDLNAMEDNLNNLNATLSEPNEMDNIELEVNESSFSS